MFDNDVIRSRESIIQGMWVANPGILLLTFLRNTVLVLKFDNPPAIYERVVVEG